MPHCRIFWDERIARIMRISPLCFIRDIRRIRLQNKVRDYFKRVIFFVIICTLPFAVVAVRR